MNEFKAGDRIKCIQEEPYFNQWVVKGQVYTVLRIVKEPQGTYAQVIELDIGRYYSSSFVLLADDAACHCDDCEPKKGGMAVGPPSPTAH